MPAEELARLYVRSGLPAAEAGRLLGVSGRIVLRAAHDHGLPVRVAGPAPRRGPTEIELVDALYADPLMRRALDRQSVPLVPAGGLISLRFPVPVRLRPDGHRYPAAALLAWLVLIYLLPARLAPRHACSRSPTPRQLVSVGREHPGRWPSRRRSCRPPTCPPRPTAPAAISSVHSSLLATGPRPQSRRVRRPVIRVGVIRR